MADETRNREAKRRADAKTRRRARANRIKARERRAQAEAKREARRQDRLNRWNAKKDSITLPRGEILIYSDEEQKMLRARLDEGYSSLEGGYGGWEDEPRPGQVSATVWRGTQAPQLTLRLILGGWPVQPPWADCDRDMRLLDGFGRPAIDAPRGERPPLLRLGGRVPHHHRRWFVEDIQWGDVDVARSVRVRAFVTVVLRMFVPVRFVERVQRRTRKRTTIHVVRARESFDAILRARLDLERGELPAARALVRRLSGLRKGEPVRVGARLRLPVGSWWRKELRRGDR